MSASIQKLAEKIKEVKEEWNDFVDTIIAIDYDREDVKAKELI
jgi:hypothetical protein